MAVVSLTGSDYPLVPLKKMEELLKQQDPPMPFLMAWSDKLAAYTKRLHAEYPKYLFDPYLNQSILIVAEERGRQKTYDFGANTMPLRSANFGN